MKKQTIITVLLLAFVTVSVYGQTDSKKVKKVSTINVYGTVADSFTKTGILDLKAALLRPDSTMVDTLRIYDRYTSEISKAAGGTTYYFDVSREPAQYILRFTHPNYKTTYVPFEMKQVSRRRSYIEGPTVYMKRVARNYYMDKDMDGGMLGDVVVTAAKPQMAWKGDTLVFYADAFNVPEGATLEYLIRQLPGVELKENGDIFVNGKKVENLMLNGEYFYKGKNKVMLENTPYFTVENVKVYNRQTEKNKYLGIKDENKKEQTMDVILKREYNRGGSATIEAGGGPGDGGDWRYKLKGFGLYYSDRTRAVLFGGANNINETMDYDEYSQEYEDKTQQAGDNHFRQVGGQFTYIGPEDKLNNSTEVSASWSDNRSENRSESETYLNGASTFGRSASTGRYKASNFELNNMFRLESTFLLGSWAGVRYTHNKNEGEGWNVSTADAMMKDSINSSWYSSRSKSSRLDTYGNANIAKGLKSGDFISFDIQGNYGRQFNPESSSLNHYTYHKLGTTDQRDRRTESPNYSYDWNAQLSYIYSLTKDLRIYPEVGIGTSESHSDRHEYLRDEVDYLFDTQNSYNQRTRNLNRKVSMCFSYGKDLKPSSGEQCFYIDVGVSTNFQRQKMDYESQPLTTNLTRNYTLWSPKINTYYVREDSVMRHEVEFDYEMSSSTPSVTDLIDRPITSDPLNIFLGNPDLKKSNQHSFAAEYMQNRKSTDQTIRFSFNASVTQDARTQGYTYNTTTGVRTYRPENIGSGNWDVGTGAYWSRFIDKKKYWHIDNEVNLNYNKSTGLALTTGSISAELSRVGSLTVGYKPSIRFQRGKLMLLAKGDISYRNIHRNITIGEQPTDIWDIGYGINGNYKLPWNFTIDTDLTMHSRRGYTDDEMNDNRLYWDASITKSFKQGKWLLKLRGYDLLGQVSSLRYSINAQGRTETWTNSMRRYALLTVSYRFTQKQKKENE